MKESTYKISGLFYRYLLTISISVMVVMVIIYSSVEFYDFIQEEKALRERYNQSQRQLVKRETEKVIEYVNLSRLFIEDKLNRQLYERTMEAWLLMENIYNKNKNQKSQNEIKAIIREALRPIRFNNDRGYYFIVSHTGIQELFPVKPELEGKNVLHTTDEKGNYPVKEEIEIIRRFGEGFVSSYWQKPFDPLHEVSVKTSYIKDFAPLGWYVGCGEFLDEVQKDIQQEAIKAIRRVRFSNNGYAFAFSFDGKCIVSTHPKFKENVNFWDTVDINGTRILPQLRELVNNIDGGYSTFYFRKTSSDTLALNVVYVRGVHDWEWIVGAGITLDEIDSVIAEERSLLFQHLFIKLFIACIVLGILMLVLYLLIRRVEGHLQVNFVQFTKNLEYAVSKGIEVTTRNIEIREILQIAEEINKVIRIRKEAEDQLQRSEALFRIVFQNVPVILIIFDDNLSPLRWNKQADEYFTFEETAKVGFSILHKQSEITNLKKILFADRFINTGGFKEHRMTTKKGERYQNWAIFETDDKKIVAVGYDIDELKKREEQLNALNQTKDKIFSIISHDLHGPFNAIMGFAQIFQARYETISDEKRLMYVKQIYDSANNMHKQLLNILQWGRLQTGNFKVNLGKVSLSSLVDEVFAVIKPQADLKSIQVHNLVDKSIKVQADSSMLFTTLQNLVSNAIKFTQKGGHVEVSAICLSELTNILVTDNGIGMNKEQLDLLFDLRNTPRRKGTANEMGTGLGIHLCKEFVERMSGHLWVTSEENQGTTVYIQLPTAH